MKTLRLVVALAATIGSGPACVFFAPIDDVKNVQGDARTDGSPDATLDVHAKDVGPDTTAELVPESSLIDLSTGPSWDASEEDGAWPEVDASAEGGGPDNTTTPETGGPDAGTAPDVAPGGTCGPTTCLLANATTSGCEGTACTYTCSAGYGDCKREGQNTDGCETPLGTERDCENCGDTCGPLQVCAGKAGCRPRPEIASRWADPTGWMDENHDPITMKFVRVGLPANTTYECRTGKVAEVSAVAWGACDADQGTQPVHRPLPQNGLDPEKQNGSYRTEYRYRIGDYTSPVLSYEFYVHHSLDGAKTCSPPFSDQVYFDVAKVYAAQNPTLFSLARWSDIVADLDAGLDAGRDAGLDAGSVIGLEKPVLRNPFVRIAFVDVMLSNESLLDGYWNARKPLPNPFVVGDINSLRHRFLINAEGTLILRKRIYARSFVPPGDCADPIKVGMSRTPIACQALVLNRSGHGLCIGTGAGDGGTAAAPTVLFHSVSGWQKIRVNHDRRCLTDPSCNDVPGPDGGPTNNPYKLYLAP